MQSAMDDLLMSVPAEIPAAAMPYSSFRLAKEMINLGKIADDKQVNSETVNAHLESLLRQRIKNNDDQAAFLLGQIHFEKEHYHDAWKYFSIAWDVYKDQRAKYQLAVMLYDNLVSPDVLASHPSPQEEACRMFEEILKLDIGSKAPDGQRDLVYCAAYNLGRACYQGYGFYPSPDKALEYFEFAAHDGDPKASVLAQTALGHIYSGPVFKDLKKAFYWHSEACGNGSVESQAALGIMYLYGIGVKQDWPSALLCLSEASSRGSLYAKASLAYFYYKRKMFTNAAFISSKIAVCDSMNKESKSPEVQKTFTERAKAMACFIYARCLHQGLGIEKDEKLAAEFYSKSIAYDSALASRYQCMVQHGEL
ncbi:unnamed protein product [Calicophoron daubneyi]|uniref:LRP2-binding protein n=1 Tax=Calicophoron daubneyi TaxID=300641 RepID=A0AAV2T9A3_CALDB